MAKIDRPNFRVKLDMCRFYDDARRFCWIFVDGSRMSQIVHMKVHISKLFNIQEPFHLMLNENEYLHPNEDIRILKENETILVSPGSGVENKTGESAGNVAVRENVSKFEERTESSVKGKQQEANFSQMSVHESTIEQIHETILNETEDRSQNDSLSIVAETEGSIISSNPPSKATDTKVIDNGSMIERFLQCTSKKKRVRYRKKKTPQAVAEVRQNEENRAAKPKIINSYVIASGKHIRFDNLDSEKDAEEQVISSETMNGASTNKVLAANELANLLSLGQNSAPPTFTSPKIKHDISKGHASDEEVHSSNLSDNTGGNVAICKKLRDGKELVNKDLETCPLMTTKPRLKDVIAFKMLKIGTDYTPQVSDFILGEVVSCCPQTSVYTFKVIQGLSEVQVPVGKFTIMEEEKEQTVNDTITLNYAQVIEPRIVSFYDPDGRQ